MSTEYRVARADDLPNGTHTVVTVGSREIGIFNVNGSYYALPNTCIHQNGPLCRGAVSGTLTGDAESGWEPTWTREGEVIICPWHSLEFHITTGQCLAYPKRRLPSYAVTVDDGYITVTL